MKAELDVYNENGEHVTASFEFENVTNVELVQLWMTDFVTALAARSPQWENAREQGGVSFVVYEEVQDGTQD